MTSSGRGLRNLPIFWKLLLPFVVLMLAMGSAGTFVIVRDLASKSAAALSERLTLRVVEARGVVHDVELYLIESANYAANVEGIAEAVARHDRAATARALESVRALKPDLDLLVALDRTGATLAEPAAATGTDWATVAPLERVRAAAGRAKEAAFVAVGAGSSLVVVAPICAGAVPCTPVGYAIAGLGTEKLASRILGNNAENAVTVFDAVGTVLAATGEPAPAPREVGPGTGTVEQRRTTTNGRSLVTGYAAFTIAGKHSGTVAVTIPAATPLGSVRDAAIRLIGVLVVAMAAAVAVGAAVSRWITRQITDLVQTSRRLGAGDLSARAPDASDDEVGELALALNRMAEQLEAQHANLEMKVEERTREIQRLLQDRTEFFAGLSHELRTPLAVILTQAKLLARDRSDGLAPEAASTIQASASQLLELVNDILDLARAESGAIQLLVRPVALKEVLDEALPMLVRLGSASEVDVTAEVPNGLPDVMADAGKLREVIINLVDNSVKYTPPGGIVEITAEPRDGVLAVAVSDNGVGIPPDVEDRVFEPFYLVSGTRPQHEEAATGLGLALTKRWVEAQGGTIGWSPRAGGGTTFTFTIPFASEVPNGATGRRSSRTPSAGRREGQREPPGASLSAAV